MAALVVVMALLVAWQVRPPRWDLVGRRPMRKIDWINAEARFIAAMASELRAGATLRGSFVASVGGAPELALSDLRRIAEVGLGMGQVAEALRGRLRFHGPALASAMSVANETGGRAAAMLESLAQMAAEDRILYRELRAASAQAKASSVVVGGLPIVFLGFQAVTGRLGELASSSLGVGVLGVGLALLGFGAATVGFMLRAATR